jgi:hypothetical protein
MSMSSQLLARGIALWNNNQQDEARRIFEVIVHNETMNESAWRWYIYSRKSDAEKITALKDFLAIFPQHVTAQKALANLEAEETASTQPEETGEVKSESVPAIQPAAVQVERPVQKQTSGYLPWLLVLLGLCLFLFSSVLYVRDRNSLRAQVEDLAARNRLISQNLVQLNTQYMILQAVHGELSNEYTSLSGRYDSLNGEYSSLQGKYGTLNNQYTTLFGQYENLSAEHASLTNSYNELMARYNDTVDSYSAYREVAITPPYIYTRQREVHLVFQKLDGNLVYWTIPSEWLEHHLRLGDEQRSHLAYDLTLYNSGTDEYYHVVDDRNFIDATPFTDLMAELYQQSPDDSTFIAEVWNIVAQLTAYNDEIDETPRFPMETLLSGGGDCEDHAILFASMILAAPTSWQVKFIYMDGDHPSQPEGVNHVIVQVITSDGSHLVEPTSQFYINPYGDSVTGWTYPISRAAN